jgi:hypothetical protein
MAKFYGAIGYSTEVETRPGVWKNQITERHYAGDTIRNSSRWSSSQDSTNDDLNINNQFSVLADPYAYQNFHEMKYIEFMGTRWKITNVEVQYPRLILTVGGEYTNGK